MRTLRVNAGDLIKIIRAFAQAGENPAAVYAAALIPPPAAPKRNPPPAPATDLKAALNASTGHITLSCKAIQPESGTCYIITRRTNAAGDFQFVGVANGNKRYTDTTIPPGTTRVDYIVRSQRSTLHVPDSAVLTVQFGAGGAVGAGGVEVSRERDRLTVDQPPRRLVA